MARTSVETLWFDGDFHPRDEVGIDLLSHGLHYGIGVFEGIRVYETSTGPVLFHWEDHLDRFYNSANQLELDIGYTPQQLTAATKELIHRENISTGYIRPIAFLGSSPNGFALDTFEQCPTHVALLAWNRDSQLNANGVTTSVSSWRKIGSDQVPTTAKTTGVYLNNILAGREASKNGYDDAIVLNQQGNVAEGATANLFLVRNGEIFTPPPSDDLLPGITRQSAIKISRDLGYTVHDQTTISRGELYTADELFFTGTGAEITPVVEVDDKPIGSGAVGTVTQDLRTRFYEIVQRHTDDYADWFTAI
jgi:branched-chain amino acid aminotransferase